SRLGRGQRKVRVDELDRHRSFADRRRAALRRSAADVARGEDAGHARLEQVVRVRGVAGEDEAVGMASDGVVQPLGARLGAEEEEEKGERKPLAALQSDGLEPSVLAVESG